MTEDKDKIIAKLKATLKLRDKQLDAALIKLESCYSSLAEERAIENEMAKRRTWNSIQMARFEEV